jgi:hypothetical protein
MIMGTVEPAAGTELAALRLCADSIIIGVALPVRTT